MEDVRGRAQQRALGLGGMGANFQEHGLRWRWGRHQLAGTVRFIRELARDRLRELPRRLDLVRTLNRRQPPHRATGAREPYREP